MPRPNVLLITGDHIRHDALGCNGNPFVRTPVFDRLAREGVTFTNSFTPDPICVPGRAALTTGCYPHKCTGNKANGGRIRDDQVKIAAHFSDYGYRTYALGKLHYVPYAPPGTPRLLHGFDHAELCEEGRILNQFSPGTHTPGLEEYHDYLYTVGFGGYERAHGIGNNDIRPAPSPVPAEHYVDCWTADRTMAAITRHRGATEDPFFIWMSFTKPHSPYDPPEPYHRLYDPRDIPLPLGADGDADGLECRAPSLALTGITHGFERIAPAGIQLARAYYYGMVTLQDECIGRVIGLLEAQGILDNTIIVYSGDHGDLLGDFGAFYKANFLNGSVRVPQIWRYPAGVQAGHRPDALVGLQDILPTLAVLTATPLPRSVDGIDLAPVLGNTAGAPEREFYVGQCLESPQQQYMVCTRDYKYIYSEMNGIEELYDLRNDPCELRNRAGSSRAQTAAMRAVLIDWCRLNGDEAMLADGDLKCTAAEPGKLHGFNDRSMGWRWF